MSFSGNFSSKIEPTGGYIIPFLVLDSNGKEKVEYTLSSSCDVIG
tara:strand:- start:149 stop:283 length:135 start_codon:yes stop_codon:yes gene_type:complete